MEFLFVVGFVIVFWIFMSAITRGDKYDAESVRLEKMAEGWNEFVTLEMPDFVFEKPQAEWDAGRAPTFWEHLFQSLCDAEKGLQQFLEFQAEVQSHRANEPWKGKTSNIPLVEEDVFREWHARVMQKLNDLRDKALADDKFSPAYSAAKVAHEQGISNAETERLARVTAENSAITARNSAFAAANAASAARDAKAAKRKIRGW